MQGTRSSITTGKRSKASFIPFISPKWIHTIKTNRYASPSLSNRGTKLLDQAHKSKASPE